MNKKNNKPIKSPRHWRKFKKHCRMIYDDDLVNRAKMVANLALIYTRIS